MGAGQRKNHHEEFLNSYAITMPTTNGFTSGHSDMGYDQFRREKFTIPIEIWVLMIITLFVFLMLLLHFCLFCELRKRRLRAIIIANSATSIPGISPPETQEDVLTPVGMDDVPPVYTVVIDQNNTTAKERENTDFFPKVVEGKRLETPPPNYMTVAPFK